MKIALVGKKSTLTRTNLLYLAVSENS